MKYPLCCLPGFSKVSKTNSGYRPSSLPEGIYRRFSLTEIKEATNNFSYGSRLGHGSFGYVYRGTIDKGTIMVAVERLGKNSGQGEIRMLQNEVKFLCQLDHPHILSLIGLCEEREEMIVVYEYMSRRSLHYYLQADKNYDPLPWKQRLKICIGAARGLHYLHTGAKYAVLHKNFTTSKILLDEDWSCKISHFGHSKMGPNSMSKASIVKEESHACGGVLRFTAPEYLMSGKFTDKCDVFSFGMVLLDVLCGIQMKVLSASELFFLRKIRTIYDFIDPYLRGRIAPECLEKYLEIASSCIQYEGNKRPAMGEVEVTLELALELQNKADRETESGNPHGQVMYEDAAIGVSVTNIWFLLRKLMITE